MTSFLKIFVSTTKNAIFRYDIWINESEEKDEKRFNFYRISTYTCQANIKCIDFNDEFLAIGGDDNQIILHDLNNKIAKKVQKFSNKSPVNTIKFSEDGQHLFAGFEDGELIVFKVDPFIMSNQWLIPHEGKPIWAICTHPLGKLGITFGGDSLVLWNMRKFEQIHSFDTKHIMDNHIETLEWSRNFNFYAIFGNREILVMAVDTGKIIREYICSSVIKSICWLDKDDILLAEQNGVITYLKLNDQEVTQFGILNKLEIACESKDDNVSFIKSTINEITIYCNCFLLVLMSNGLLSLWRFSHQKCTLDLINYVNIGCRAVCMKILNLNNKLPVTNEFINYTKTLPVNIKCESPTIKHDVKTNEASCKNAAASGVSQILENLSLKNDDNDNENQLIDATIDDQNVTENITSSDENIANSDEMETEDAFEKSNSIVIPNKLLPVFDANNETQYFVDNPNISFYIGNMPVSEEIFYNREHYISQKNLQLMDLSKQIANLNHDEIAFNNLPLSKRIPPPRTYQKQLHIDESTDSQSECCDYDEIPNRTQIKRFRKKKNKFWKRSKLSDSCSKSSNDTQSVTCQAEQTKSTQSKDDEFIPLPAAEPQKIIQSNVDPIPIKLPAEQPKIIQSNKDLDQAEQKKSTQYKEVDELIIFKLPAAEPQKIIQSNVDTIPIKLPAEQPKIIQSNKNLDVTLFKLPAAPPKVIQNNKNVDTTPFPFEQPFKLPAKKRKIVPCNKPFDLPAAAPQQIIQSTLKLPSEQPTNKKDVVIVPFKLPTEKTKAIPLKLPSAAAPKIIQSTSKLPCDQTKEPKTIPGKEDVEIIPFKKPKVPPKRIQSNKNVNITPSQQSTIQSIASLSLDFVNEKLSAHCSQENHQNEQLLQPSVDNNEQCKSNKNRKVIIKNTKVVNRKLPVKSSTVLAAQKITKKSYTHKTMPAATANSPNPSTFISITSTPKSSVIRKCPKLTPSNQRHHLHRPIDYNSDDDFQQTPKKLRLSVGAKSAIKKRIIPQKSKLIEKRSTNINKYDFDADFDKSKKCAKIGSVSKINKSNSIKLTDAEQNKDGEIKKSQSKLMKLNDVDKTAKKLPKAATKTKIIESEMTKSQSKLMSLCQVDKTTKVLPKSPTKRKIVDDEMTKSQSKLMKLNDGHKTTKVLPKSPTKTQKIDGEVTKIQSKLINLSQVDKSTKVLPKSPTKTQKIDDEMTKSQSKLMNLSQVDKSTKVLPKSPTKTQKIDGEVTKIQSKLINLSQVDKTTKVLPKSPTKRKIIDEQKSTGNTINTYNDDATFKSPKRNLRSNHIEYDSDAKFDSPRTKLAKKNLKLIN